MKKQTKKKLKNWSGKRTGVFAYPVSLKLTSFFATLLYTITMKDEYYDTAAERKPHRYR
jgi:hypothetical protein